MTAPRFHRSTTTVKFAAGLATVALVASACGGSSTEDSSGTGTDTGGSGSKAITTDVTATLNGAGATFPQSFYEEAIEGFKEFGPNVTVNYGGGGSGEGQSKLADGVVEWAGSDSTVKDADKAKFKGGEFLYFPTVAAPITVSYNLPGVEELKLTAEVIAQIFERKITTWNDPKIAAENEGAELPDTKITVARRSDGSGTTSNFTAYLTKAAGSSWTLGEGKEVPWPADTQGGNGNGGVAQIVKGTEGAVGYVDFSDAKATGLQTAAIKNRAGNFVAPSLEATTAALEGAEIKPDLTYDPIDADGAEAYPITAPTYVLVYKTQKDQNTVDALGAWLTYLLTEGQTLAKDVDFAPLPAELDTKALEQIKQITVG